LAVIRLLKDSVNILRKGAIKMMAGAIKNAASRCNDIKKTPPNKHSKADKHVEDRPEVSTHAHNAEKATTNVKATFGTGSQNSMRIRPVQDEKDKGHVKPFGLYKINVERLEGK
jgi:hypothetical protein